LRYDSRLPEMERLLLQKMKTYMVLSGPYSPTIKGFAATEISRSSLLSNSPTLRVGVYNSTSRPVNLIVPLRQVYNIASFPSWAVSTPYQNAPSGKN
jgi:hypothetical protein